MHLAEVGGVAALAGPADARSPFVRSLSAEACSELFMDLLLSCAAMTTIRCRASGHRGVTTVSASSPCTVCGNEGLLDAASTHAPL